MILVDILIWAILAAFAVKGFLKGLVREVCSLLGLVAGGWAACSYYPFLAEKLRHLIHLPLAVMQAVAFILIFLALGLLFYLFGHLLTILFKIVLLGWVNRFGGVVFGVLEGAFILCLVLYFGTARPMPERLKGGLQRSATARHFVATGREIVAGWDYTVNRPSPQRTVR